MEEIAVTRIVEKALETLAKGMSEKLDSEQTARVTTELAKMQNLLETLPRELTDLPINFIGITNLLPGMDPYKHGAGNPEVSRNHYMHVPGAENEEPKIVTMEVEPLRAPNYEAAKLWSQAFTPREVLASAVKSLADGVDVRKDILTPRHHRNRDTALQESEHGAAVRLHDRLELPHHTEFITNERTDINIALALGGDKKAILGETNTIEGRIVENKIDAARGERDSLRNALDIFKPEVPKPVDQKTFDRLIQEKLKSNLEILVPVESALQNPRTYSARLEGAKDELRRNIGIILKSLSPEDQSLLANMNYHLEAAATKTRNPARAAELRDMKQPESVMNIIREYLPGLEIKPDGKAESPVDHRAREAARIQA